MAYDNVSKPVFYIDHHLYHKALGSAIESGADEIFRSVLVGNIFPEEYNSDFGIFESTSTGTYSIKDNFHSKVVMGSNNFQLPFIFQPNSEVEEYAICRVVNKPSFNQVANGVYDTSLDIVEVF